MSLAESRENSNGTNGDLDGTMVDIGPILASLGDDARQAAENVLTRALIYVEDADDALRSAMSIRTEAERYRSEVETQTVQATEQLCTDLRIEAQRDLEEAARLHEQAQSAWEEADRAREVAETVKTEADAYQVQIEAQAQEEAKATLEQSREEAAREANEIRNQAAEEIKKAVAGIQKMRDAAQAELEAQKLYTEATRIKAMAPSRDESTEMLVAKAPKTKTRSRQRNAA